MKKVEGQTMGPIAISVKSNNGKNSDKLRGSLENKQENFQ